MAEYQAAILITQMERFEKYAKTRSENAEYLTLRLKDIPGIVPQKFYEGTTRAAYYKYALRYKKEYFNDIPREKISSALKAEGIPSPSGYPPLNKEGLIEDALNSKNFQKIYSKERLKKYREQNNCPDNDQLCKENMRFGNILLGTKKDMDDIYNAFLKIYENRDKLT